MSLFRDGRQREVAPVTAGRKALPSCSRLGIAKYPLAALLALGATAPADAAVVHATGSVTVLLTYANFGNGDVMVRLSSNHPSCVDGYWLSPSQPGFKTNLAFLLAARAAGEAVLIGAEDTLLWPGSTGRYCRIDFVGTPY
jgi:hypothetical protein